MGSDNTLVKQNIGYLPEESPLYENMTVQQYLIFFSELYQSAAQGAEKRIDELLDSLKFNGKTKYTGETFQRYEAQSSPSPAAFTHPSILVWMNLTRV